MSVTRSDLLHLVNLVRQLCHQSIYGQVESSGSPHDCLITIEEKSYVLEDHIHDLIERVERD